MHRPQHAALSTPHWPAIRYLGRPNPMQLARVIGDVVASRKEPAFEGIALLLIQPLAADGQDTGRPIVAVDSVGAGVGEHVFFVRGKEASFPFHPAEVPADAGIVGIVDHWSTTTGGRDAGRDGGRDARPQPPPLGKK